MFLCYMTKITSTNKTLKHKLYTFFATMANTVLSTFLILCSTLSETFIIRKYIEELAVCLYLNISDPVYYFSWY